MDSNIAEVIEKSQNTRREELIECRKTQTSLVRELRGSAKEQVLSCSLSPGAVTPSHRRGFTGSDLTVGERKGLPSRGLRAAPAPPLTGEAGEAAGQPCPQAPWRKVVRTWPWRSSGRLSNRNLESDQGSRAASLRGAEGSAARAGSRSRPEGGKPSGTRRRCPGARPRAPGRGGSPQHRSCARGAAARRAPEGTASAGAEPSPAGSRGCARPGPGYQVTLWED